MVLIMNIQKINEQYKQLLTEEDNLEFLKDQLRDLTHHNQHTSALKEVCIYFNLDDLLEKVNDIEKVHEQQGYLTMEQAEERYEIFKQVFSVLEEKLGVQTANEIRSCL